MVVWKQIKVMFFLGVMGIMMLHNALPHVHHSHESHEPHGEATTKTRHHHNTHGNAHEGHDHNQNAGHQADARDRHYADVLANHHSDEQANEDDPRGFLLSFLLDNHSHSFHTHEIIQPATPCNHYIRDKHVPDIVVLDSHHSFCEYENQFLHRFSLFKQAYYVGPLSFNTPPRGPPSIG